MLGQGQTIKDFQNRFPWLFYAIAAAFFLLSARLVYLQVYKGSFYRRFSEQNSLRPDKLPGPRGLVFDRNYKLLVDNRLQMDVTITPQYAKDPKAVMSRLAQLSGDNPDRLLTRYLEKIRGGAPKFQPISIIEDAPWPLIVKIESSKEGLAGVEVESRIRRTYLQQDIGSHLFGYLSEVTKKDLEQTNKNGASEYMLGDWIGRAGLERRWEKYLRGTDGVRFVVVNAHGHRLAQSAQDSALAGLKQNLSPQPGNNLVLTIDADLQAAAAAGLKGKMGAAVALDPRTGEVLALISQPSFDPTEMTSKGPELWQSFMKNTWGPLRNKTLQDHFPPGSTFKPFTALAGLEAGLIDEHTSVSCPGYYRFGNRAYHCWKKGGHGTVDLHKALQTSCDVYFYSLAARLGIDTLSKVAQDFGFGRRTGIELPNEVPGNMPTEAWKMETYNQVWTPGETLSVAIGQGANDVTPLQMANSYATLVNGGNLYRPYIVSRIENQQGEVIQRFGPQIISSHHVNPKYIEFIKNALFDVANTPGGTAYSATKTDEKLISGKTGTAQVIGLSAEDIYKPCELLPFEKRNHGWFVGYAPRDNPEIAVAVLAMHECHGASAAAPVVRDVITKWWEKKQAEAALKGPQPAAR